MATSLLATPAAAQVDCDAYPDWDDIEWFRACLEQQGRDADWATVELSGAAWFTDNPAIVQLRLRAGADPQAVNNEGLTPLHRGAVNGNPVVTAHLLAAGADPNALDNEGYTPLHHSAAGGASGRVIARLLAAGADPLAESNDGRTPLHSALRYAVVRDVISALVQGGGAANLTPLRLAALESDAVAVTSLLAGGADPNVVDGYGWGPLHFAVPLAGPEVVSALLEAGADPNARTVDGLTALHLAARHRTSAVVADLLKAGADPNAEAGEEEAGRTPLHTAAQWNDDPSTVLALLEGGSDAAKRDGNGVRAVDFARFNSSMTGSAAYPRLLVTQPTALVAGRTVTGNLQPGDGVGQYLGYYDEWSYSARAGQNVVIAMDSEEVDAFLVVLRDDGTQVASERRTLATNPIRRVYTEDMELVYRIGVDIGQRDRVERDLSSGIGSYPEVWCAWSDPGDDHAVIISYTGVVPQDLNGARKDLPWRIRSPANDSLRVHKKASEMSERLP